MQPNLDGFGRAGPQNPDMLRDRKQGGADFLHLRLYGSGCVLCGLRA